MTQESIATTSAQTFETSHEDSIHDAQLDYYGKRLATCSSDRSIRVFSVQNGQNQLLATLLGHEAPVWQVCWAHPKFGSVLASCSYDAKVIIWKDHEGTWTKLYQHLEHAASVNSIAFSPHEHGLELACASSDGKVSILTYNNTWETQTIDAHSTGVNSVSWAPISHHPEHAKTKRIATGGCDNIVKIFNHLDGVWKEECLLEGHSDWVRDVAFAPSIGLGRTYLASCSQDKSVLIWTRDTSEGAWTKKLLKPDAFPDVVWRVSWSMGGNVLAVSCGDNQITLWKENIEGVFCQIGNVNE